MDTVIYSKYFNINYSTDVVRRQVTPHIQPVEIASFSLNPQTGALVMHTTYTLPDGGLTHYEVTLWPRDFDGSPPRDLKEPLEDGRNWFTWLRTDRLDTLCRTILQAHMKLLHKLTHGDE